MIGGSPMSYGAGVGAKPPALKGPLGGPVSQPLPRPNTGIGGQATQRAPDMISIDSTQSAINNRMGQAHMMGDPRLIEKQMARNGLSSSRGTAHLAQVGQQQALGEGRADSAGIAAQDQMSNAKARLDSQYAQEREAQALAMVQHALGQANWAEGFAGRQANASIDRAKQQALLDQLRRLFG